MNPQMRDWVKDAKSKIGPSQVDVAKHVPTDNELNNLCYLSMKYVIGWQMRGVDFTVVKMMGGSPKSVTDLGTKFIPELAEYMWDHLMGEPDDIKPDDLVVAIQTVCDQLFSMDEKARNSVA